MNARRHSCLVSDTFSGSPLVRSGSLIAAGIAKSVFQVHDIDAEGKSCFARQLKRRYVALSAALSSKRQGLKAMPLRAHSL